MQRFFDVNDPNYFIAYSPSHLLVLGILAALIILLYFNRHWFKVGERGRYGRYVLAALLVLSEVTLNIWYISEGVYDVKDTLPLELCSISLYLCVFMLVFKSYKIFQIAYFTGIGGAIQALLTPVLGYAYPHFRFVEFFTAHIVIILAVLYMVWVEGFRPTLKSIAITMIFLNVLLILVGFINYLSGGNYMFLAGKPNEVSLLDFLGPYPWYLISLELVAVILFLLLYLPFSFKRAVKN